MRGLYLPYLVVSFLCLAVVAGFTPARAVVGSPALPSTVSIDEDYVTDIEVTGNQRIEKQTVLSYLGIREGSRYSQYDVDSSLKRLFATGFFADADIHQRRVGPNELALVVDIVENPVINQVAFEGNSAISDDDLAAEVELRARAIYTRTKIQNDVNRVLELYRRAGRYSAMVEPKVIPLDQNRVDLAFEISEGPVASIKSVSFIGNEIFSDSDLAGVISSESSVWYQFLSNNDRYDPDRLQFDQELLRRHYVSEGYADFSVKSAIAELTPEKDSFYITFTLFEGPQYRFGNINVTSNLAGAEAGEFDAFVTTPEGDIYNADLVEDTIDAISDELGNRGFAFVDIKPGFKRNKDELTINVNFQINEGPRVYVERINIDGNSRTLDEVIRREFRLAEGDPFSTSKLARSEQRINNLGFFEKVTVNNEAGSAPDKTVINVEVEEKSTGELSLGAGFSSVDGALADIGIRESNLLGKGQDLRLRALLAAERQQFDIGFTEPYFLDREISAGFDLFKTRQDLRTESSFDRETQGGAIRFGYTLSEHLEHKVFYRAQENKVTDVATNASRFIRDQEGTTITSAVGHSLTWDHRNNKFDPSDGYYLRFDQEVAGLGGDSKYLKHEVKSGYFHSVMPQWVLKFMGQGGHVLGLGEDVFINDRFFIGGRDFRGFDNAGLGPRDTITQDALGGNIYYVGTAETSFPLGLPEELGFMGAVFMDVGSVWNVDDNGPEVADNSSIRASAGVGVQWASPFGPIRIDFAKALVKEDEDETQIVHFSFGTRF